ncbi:MAG: LuxR C-terminal-related transcriptional regulator [Acidimicrobiia bacterium]
MTLVHSDDPVSHAGITSQLRPRPEVQLVEELSEADVVLVVAEEADDAALAVCRAIRRTSEAQVVVVLSRLEDRDALAALEAGVSGFVRRSQASPERLVEAVGAARAGGGSAPADVLGRLFDQVGRLQRQVLAPRGLQMSGLTDRETQVLRLVADGLDTAEIAQQLSYSQRTIKNVIHDVTMRFCLRNRTHAVAYVMREGLI